MQVTLEQVEEELRKRLQAEIQEKPETKDKKFRLSEDQLSYSPVQDVRATLLEQAKGIGKGISDYWKTNELGEMGEDLGNAVSAASSYVSDRGLGVIPDAANALIVDPAKDAFDSYVGLKDAGFKMMLNPKKFKEAYGEAVGHASDLVPVAAEGIAGMKAIASTSRALAPTAKKAVDALTPDVAVKAKAAVMKRARDLKPLPVEDAALKRLAADLVDDGISYDDLTKRLMAWDGQPTTMVDLVGDVGVARVRDTASNIGPARETLKRYSDDILGGQDKRARDLIESNLSSKTDYLAEIEQLAKVRSTQAKPLYDAAHAQVVKPTGNIRMLVGAESGQNAIKNAMKIAAEERQQLTGVVQNGKRFSLADEVPVKTLDYIKQGWDDVIETYRDKTSKQLVLDKLGRARNKNLRSFISEVDQLAPDYAKARSVWAGPSSAMDAMKQGQSYMTSTKRSAADIRQAMKGMTDSEKEFFRAGAVQELLSKISKRVDGGNKFAAISNRADVRDKIKALFDGDQAKADEFMRRIGMESERSTRASLISTRAGSPTNVRNKASKQFGVQDAADLTSAQGWGRMGMKAVDALTQGKMLQRQKAIDEAYARIMTAPINTPDELLGLLPPRK